MAPVVGRRRVCRMTRAQLEASLEGYFRKKVRLVGGRTEKLAPTTKGMPDRLVLLPEGRLYLVELKIDSGRLSPAQVVWHSRAAELGTEVHVVTGRAGVDAWIREVFASYDPQPRKPGRKKSTQTKEK